MRFELLYRVLYTYIIFCMFSIAFRIKLLQTTIGDRLPIVQGGSFAYLPAAFGIIFNAELQAIADPSERFERTMRTIQGAIIVSGIVQMAIGYSGILPFVLRGIGPVTIAPVIAAIGLGLYGVGFSGVAACWPLGLTQMFTIVLFSQYLKFVKIGRVKVFSLFPVILAIAFTWSLGAILTSSGVWEEGNACRTDGKNDILAESPWFRIPYPFQWGTPIFKGWAIVPMLGSMIAGMIESIGDYFSCARVSGAPPPTPGIISRGLACEGIGVLIAGMIGTANGTTSYSENSECKKFCLNILSLLCIVCSRVSHCLFPTFLLRSRCHCRDQGRITRGGPVRRLHDDCFRLHLQGRCAFRDHAGSHDERHVLRSLRSDRVRGNRQPAVRRYELASEPLHRRLRHLQRAVDRRTGRILPKRRGESVRDLQWRRHRTLHILFPHDRRIHGRILPRQHGTRYP